MSNVFFELPQAWSPRSQKDRKPVFATMIQTVYHSSPGVDCKTLVRDCYYQKHALPCGKNCLLIAPIILKATFHLTISVRGQRATSKIQRNNYYHGSRGPSLTDKTMSVFLIFTQGTHRNVKKSLSVK